AFACALLIASFLLAISLWNLFTRPLGFQARGRVAMQVFLPPTPKPATAWRQMRPALAALPHVKSAAAARQIPFSKYGGNFSGIAARDGQSVGDQPLIVRSVSASHTYFQTLGVRLLHGRLYTDTGFAKNHGVILGARLAKRLFGTTNAVGHTMREGRGHLRVVGVVGNVSWQATPV